MIETLQSSVQGQNDLLNKQESKIQELQRGLSNMTEQAQDNSSQLHTQSTQCSDQHTPTQEEIMKQAQEKYNSSLGNCHGIQLVRRYMEEPGRQRKHHHESHIVPNLPDWHPTWTP